MGRNHGGAAGESRSSALWGTGSRGGDHRSGTPRGRRGRGILVTAVAAVSLVLPFSAGADDKTPAATAATYVAPAVYQAASKDPRGTIQVIIQSAGGAKGAEHSFKDAEKAVESVEKDADEAVKVAEDAAKTEQDALADAGKAAGEARVASAKASRADKKAAASAGREAERAARRAESAAARAEQARRNAQQAAEQARRRRGAADRLGSSKLGKLRDELRLVGAVSVQMPAGWVHELARLPGLTVTLDAPVEATALSASQLWPYQNGASAYWGSALNPGPKPPAIAIVDSGIERGVVGFGVAGSRIVDRRGVHAACRRTPRARTGAGTARSSPVSLRATRRGTPVWPRGPISSTST